MKKTKLIKETRDGIRDWLERVEIFAEETRRQCPFTNYYSIGHLPHFICAEWFSGIQTETGVICPCEAHPLGHVIEVAKQMVEEG